jgi:hypothetical protein
MSMSIYVGVQAHVLVGVGVNFHVLSVSVQFEIDVKNINVKHGNFSVGSRGSYKGARKSKGTLTATAPYFYGSNFYEL